MTKRMYRHKMNKLKRDTEKHEGGRRGGGGGESGQGVEEWKRENTCMEGQLDATRRGLQINRSEQIMNDIYVVLA